MEMNNYTSCILIYKINNDEFSNIKLLLRKTNSIFKITTKGESKSQYDHIITNIIYIAFAIYFAITFLHCFGCSYFA